MPETTIRRPLVHETTMSTRLVWLVAVYGMGAYLISSTLSLQALPRGFGNANLTDSVMAGPRAMAVVPLLVGMGAGSLYNGKYNHMMLQGAVSTLWVGQGMVKTSTQEFRGSIAQSLNSYEWVHDMVFWIDALGFLLYAFIHVIPSFRYRKTIHGAFLTLVIVYNGLLHIPLFPQFLVNGSLQVDTAAWGQQFCFTLVTIFLHPIFSGSE